MRSSYPETLDQTEGRTSLPTQGQSSSWPLYSTVCQVISCGLSPSLLPWLQPLTWLQPCSPGAQNPFSAWPEKSVHFMEQIGSFPSWKNLALEISLPQLRIISHFILQPQLCFRVPYSKSSMCSVDGIFPSGTFLEANRFLSH